MFGGKNTKNSTNNMKNKPNSPEDKFGAKHSYKRIYERFHPLPKRKNKPNQTQFKPKQTQFEPNCRNAQIIISCYLTSKYKKSRRPGQKNKPKQTQLKPK